MFIRGSTFNSFKDDAWSGAVRIWGEVVLVIFRMVELVAGMFEKNKH